MRFFSASRNCIWVAALCLCAQGQTPPANEAKGLAPRASPADYPAQARAGALTIAAEFARHGVPTAGGTFSTEDFIAVEVGFYGAAGARVNSPPTISRSASTAKSRCPAGLTGWSSLLSKIPNGSRRNRWGERSRKAASTPAETMPTIPRRRQRTCPCRCSTPWNRRCKKPCCPRAIPSPQAGLLFFQYRGKSEGIQSVELIYDGAAGKATLNLHP